MRRAAKVDANQEAIVKALRAHGWSVKSLAALGGGIPDLLVGVKGLNILLEVKDGSKPPSARRLTLDEQRFFGAWNGHRALVESPEQAVAAVRRHLREMQAPDWTAEDWRQVAAVLWLHAGGLGIEENVRLQLSAPREREVARALARGAEAMAQALEGGA